MKNARTNIVLIGMPGSGKSTVGVLLAKRLCKSFLDTDLYLQRRCQRSLAEILAREGTARFRSLEEEAVLSLDCADTVIATGGSVVYSPPAMGHLRRLGVIVHLQVEIEELAKRLGDLDARAVVRAPGQTLASLFEQRAPLYARYAEVVVPAGNASQEEVTERVIRFLDERDAGW